MMSRVSRWGKYVDERIAYRDMKTALEKGLGRKLTEDEDGSVQWIADGGWMTCGSLVDMFQELARKVE